MILHVQDNNSLNVGVAESAGIVLSVTDTFAETEIADNNAIGISVADNNDVSLSIGEGIQVIPDPYTGAYEVTPKAYEEQVLQTALKTMTQNVTVHEVPYYETPNTDGNTVYIASEV